MNYIEGSKLVNYSEIVETDHRGYIIDVAMEEYFDVEFSQWDNINHVMLNLSKQSHRETFVEVLEEQLNIYQLENDIEQMKVHTTRYQMEQVDEIITRIFTTALKKVEGMKRTVPYSNEKMKRRATLLYWKMKLRQIKQKVVDKELMEKRKEEAQVIDNGEEENEIEELIQKAKDDWEDIVKQGKEIYEKEMLDYHHYEVVCENEDQRKTKNKILSGIKKKMNRMYSFHYLSRHVGKGEREGIKRLHEVNENNKIINTYVERERIEQKLIEHNKTHFTKAHDTIAYKDKIYDKLRDDRVRDKILSGNLNREECDDE